MRTRSLIAPAVLCALLAGCAIVPAEPYGPPAAYVAPPVVVVRPAPRYYGYYGRPYR